MCHAPGYELGYPAHHVTNDSHDWDVTHAAQLLTGELADSGSPTILVFSLPR